MGLDKVVHNFRVVSLEEPCSILSIVKHLYKWTPIHPGGVITNIPALC